MSMHKRDESDELKSALKKHGLAAYDPSQISDAFRCGWDACLELAHADAELAKMHHAQAFGAGVDLSPQWQTIDSAPRDARAVLVMRNTWPGAINGVAEDCNGHNTYVAEWWENESENGGAWVCYMDMVKDPRCPIEPTHWMPLPKPPT